MNELLIEGRGYISNELVNAQYDYSAGEIDLLIKILAKLRRAKTDAEKQHLRLSKMELLPTDTDSKRGYEYLRKHFRGLQSKPLEVFYKETGQYYISNVISEATINTNQSMISVSITPKMVAILCDTNKQYTGYEIKSLLSLKSKHAKRLYLMCCQFRNTGIKYLNIPELKKSLRCVDQYDKTHDFLRRVIIPATQEITAKTELECTYSAIRTGKSIDQLCIEIKLNNAAAEVWGNDKQIEYMMRCKLANWQIEQVCEYLTPEEIHPILYGMKLNAAKIQNPGAYLATVFSDHGVPMARRINKQLSLYEQQQQNNTSVRG